MAFNLGGFMTGFATQAQKIEEESAKIGMDLLKEALDDFRVEAKAYKEEVDRDTKEYTELANILTPLLKDPNKVTAVLDRGKGFAKLFIQKAEDTAERKGYSSVADLVRVSDAFEGTIDPIDWINSGAPIDISAPSYVGPKEMRTGVFKREIGQGDKREEGIRKAYLGDQTRTALSAPSAEIDIMAPVDESKTRFGTPSRTDISYTKATIKKTLADMSGVEADYYTDQSGALQVKLAGASEQQQARLRADTERFFETWYGQAKEADKALPFATLEGDTISFAAGTYDATNDPFYKYAPQVSSVGRVGGGTRGTTANTAGLTSGAGQPQQQPAQPQQQPAPQNYANHPQIKSQINNMGASTRSRRNIVAGVLVSAYNMSVADARKEAERLIP